jgi:hypothetical protein
MISAGAAVGGMMSVLVGVGLPSSRLEKFKEDIEAGNILILVDIPRERTEEIQGIVTKHHPEAEFDGIEPIQPPFP